MPSARTTGDASQLTLEAVLVQAADAISGARPGARRESLENYIKRIEALEQVANAFEGVETSFAIQAGREIRIMVKPEEIDDLGAMRLSRRYCQARSKRACSIPARSRSR